MPKTKKRSLQQQRAADRLRKRDLRRAAKTDDPDDSCIERTDTVQPRPEHIETPSMHEEFTDSSHERLSGSMLQHQHNEPSNLITDRLELHASNPEPHTSDTDRPDPSTSHHNQSLIHIPTEPTAIVCHEDAFYGLDPYSVLKGSIEIQVLDYYSALLKVQFSQTNGLIPPSVLYQQTLSTEVYTEQLVPEGVETVQLHYINNHYLVSHRKNQTVTVYDSLQQPNRIQTIRTQLERMYGDISKLIVKYVVAQSQGSTVDCGLFAAANAYYLLKGSSPCCISLNQSALRQHLKTCLLNQQITDFPSTPTSHSDQLLNRYFVDQSNRQLESNRKLNKDAHLISTNQTLQSQSSVSKQTVKQRKWRHKQRQLNLEAPRHKESLTKSKQRQKLRNADLELARLKRVTEQHKVRQKHRDTDLKAARDKRAKEQHKVRQKHRDTDLKAARDKRAKEQHKVRQKHRDTDLKAARDKRAKEQHKVRQKHRNKDLKAARDKLANEQHKLRQKHTDKDLKAARDKRANEQHKVRQKHRDKDLKAARDKLANEQHKVRQKHRDKDLKAARDKLANEQHKVRQKHRDKNLKAARDKRANEQHKVRQKNRDKNLKAARDKRANEQHKVRQKHRDKNLKAARDKRANEQHKVRQKHRDENLKAARDKHANEQHKLRQKHRDKNLKAARDKRANEQHKLRQKHRDKNLKAARDKRANEQQNYRKKDCNMQTASVKFSQDINQFPDYVCTCCSRMLYKRSVIGASNISFKAASSELLNQCLSHHVSAEGKEWICQTCLRYLRQNKMPPQSDANNLKLPPIPEDLQGLSSLEERLLSQRYPFMKMLALPKGRQTAIKGAVVNIPVDIDTVTEMLPRIPSQAGFVPLKLKRKVEYKGHYSFQYIRPDRIKNAIQWLKQNNILYSNVKVNDQWEADCAEDDSDTWNELTGQTQDTETNENPETTHSKEDNTDSSEDSTDESHVEDIVPISADPSQNVQFETCVQPTDMSIDASRILSIAPGEGKRPLAILGDKNFKELSFPTLFPSGKFGYTYERPVNISVKKYFQRRILEKGGQFASNIEYLFVAQFLTEWQQIMSSMSVALRKSKPAQNGANLTAAFFKNSDHIRPLLTKDDAYRFLRPIRGSPPYWQNVMFELLAAVKQFKIFTWFLTLSAADIRWEDTLRALARQQGQSLSQQQIQDMTWEERCTLLRSNPTTAARHFNHRVQSLFTDVILTPASPLGKVTKYFYRIEFQQRGSPHVHAILWVEDAPQPENASEHICSFVDKYIQACLPRDDDELLKLVTDLQTHTHTSTCTKRGGVCRFSFPKPVSEKTILSRPQHDKNEAKTRRAAIEILSKVKECLQEDCDNEALCVKDLLNKAGISTGMYYQALENATKTPTIFLKRDPCETCINNYNPDILRLWKANTDLQFVTSPYAAIAYITSYITKDEREVGTVLQAVSKEMRNLQINDQMKKVAFAFSNARNVSAQEAAYRILGLPLYVSNFTTVWIPSGLPENRIRILKPKKRLETLDDNDENVFSPNIIDRFSLRPSQLENMCLAEFGMWYEVQCSTKEPDHDLDRLPSDHPDEDPTGDAVKSNNMDSDLQVIDVRGYGKMRKRTSPAVIRFHQCSQSKNPELFAYNRMLLFMPWTDEKRDLLGGFDTYSDHYNSKKDDIENRFKMLLKNEELVQEAMAQFQEHGPPRHAWDDIAPETEHTEADLIEEGYQSDENFAILDPESNQNATFNEHDNQLPVSVVPRCVLEANADILNDTDYRKLVQSLNVQQKHVFQHTLNWAVKQTQNTARVVEPQHVFVTGGAGTGKSHLISAIYNMVNRELRQPGEDPTKPKVLLMAPTGTAAFNIGGLTVHSALQLPPKLDDTYRKLSDSTCNRLRVQLAYLRIIIIDEISMVSGVCFNYIDKRLQQIKDSTSPFGGVTVLAIGDLYQLRPVGKYVFEPSSSIMNRLAGSLWHLFRMFQLEEIMRQKDDADFAALLNRVRMGKHSAGDISILQHRTVETTDPQYNREALHIFATNAETDKHNNKRLRELGQPILLLTRREKKPASLESHSVSSNTADTGGLLKTLEICKNARVMIVRNIDVEDGLVNGAQGQIVDFVPNSGNIHTILVKFDRQNIGRTARASSPLDLSHTDPSVVPIRRIDISFSTSSNRSSGLQITWTQFPLKLAFACTIHKVQGLSVDELVVSFEHKFSGGQAYVALSRCRTLQGLQLLHFDAQKITQSASVQKEMLRLQQKMLLPSPYSCILEPLTCDILTFGLLNARSLRLHFPDILNDTFTHLTEMLFFTESHIYENQTGVHTLPGYSSIHKPQDSNRNHHGLATYFRDNLQCQQLQLPQTEHLEILGVQLQYQNAPSIAFVLIYRSPSVSSSELLTDLAALLKACESLPYSVLLGDFNDDALAPQYQTLKSFMDKYLYMFRQASTSHKLGSCLDHVYLSRALQSMYSNCTYHPTYFSDHYYVITQLQRPH